jgi:hypothetical protein
MPTQPHRVLTMVSGIDSNTQQRHWAAAGADQVFREGTLDRPRAVF